MSLTPKHRSSEATDEAMQEGLMAGGLVLAPALGGLYIAMRNSAGFVKATNWQSRTAMVIMPALFTFAWTSERHLDHKMQEIARESQHSRDTVKWAEEVMVESKGEIDKEIHLMDLYRRSVEESGVNVVPGDKLGLHHRFANYLLANPFKVLAGLAVPSVALIYYGRQGKEHLQFSVKLLHTRVFGQFTTLSLMLGIMGFHQYMSTQGKFITQVEADQRVEEMAHIRKALQERLDKEEERQELQAQEIARAHEQVLRERQEAKKAKQATKVVATSPTAATVTATSPE